MDHPGGILTKTTFLVCLVIQYGCGSSAPHSLCGDMDCGEHGQCVASGAQAQCDCEDGYVDSSGTCVPEGSDGDADSDHDIDTDDDVDPDIDTDDDVDPDIDTDTDVDPDIDTDDDVDPDVSCEEICNGSCESCEVEGHEGTCMPIDDGLDPANDCGQCQVCDGRRHCRPVDAGTDPRDDCDADEQDPCGLTGLCGGDGACEYGARGTICSDGLFCTARDRCNGRGSCMAGQQSPCSDHEVCLEEDMTCCSPDCDRRECGDDGCGGRCGRCPRGATCNEHIGQCEPCDVGDTFEHECPSGQLVPWCICNDRQSWSCIRSPENGCTERDSRCDDGTEPTCNMIPPICERHEILAHQEQCYVCVNPETCVPWGEPQCDTHMDCPDLGPCDPCGSSSCPGCMDCVAACDERNNSCDDGTEPACFMEPPFCEPPLILAFQNSCYRCVDADTCHSADPGGA